jgi:ketohexokinase/beta-glucosidase
VFTRKFKKGKARYFGDVLQAKSRALEKRKWGTISQQSYCEQIVPLIYRWMRMNPRLQLMQDGAPGHAAGEIKKKPASHDITAIHLPAYSPDLNPIKTVWKKMNDYI